MLNKTNGSDAAINDGPFAGPGVVGLPTEDSKLMVENVSLLWLVACYLIVEQVGKFCCKLFK